MAIKQSLKRLELPNNVLGMLLSDGFMSLPIRPEEALSVMDLPALHHDPFDRMLIAQAKLNDLVLITRDKQITTYPVVTILA